MRKILAVAFVFVLFSAAFAYADSLKIVQFDLQQVAEQSKPYKEAQATAERKLTPVKNKLEQQKKAIEKEITDAGSTPSRATQEAILKKQEIYLQEAAAFLQEVQNSELQIRSNIDAVILEAAANYAKANKADMVVDQKYVLFQNKDTIKIEDVTKAMIDEVNKVWDSLPKK